MKYDNVNLLADLEIRKNKLLDRINESGSDGCLLTTNVNLFYMTGHIYTGYLYMLKDGRVFHFIKRPNNIQLESITYIRKPEQIAEELEKMGIPLPKKILLETDVMPYSECQRIIASLNNPQVGNASFLMRNIRSIKTGYEILQVRKCARQHESVYKLIPSLFKRGMSDLQLQIEIEKQMRLHGSLGIFRSYGENMDIYMGSLLVGENAEAPSPFDFALGGAGSNPNLPIGVSNTKIKEGQTIMIDMAGNYQPWMTDMTRVFSVGKTSDLAYKAHEVSIEINNKIIDIAKPGIICSELYNVAIKIVKKNKLEEYFMGTKQQAKFIGHGLGLEINEPPVITPRSQEILIENIIFALEPKFVIPQIGAVGIENTYLVSNEGIEKITQFEENIIQL